MPDLPPATAISDGPASKAISGDHELPGRQAWGVTVMGISRKGAHADQEARVRRDGKLPLRPNFLRDEGGPDDDAIPQVALGEVVSGNAQVSSSGQDMGQTLYV